MSAFFKYQATENDFILVEGRAGAPWPTPEQIAVWCDRHRGIGADGVLIFLSESGADGRMVLFNPDGSRPEMCGNGLRCVALHALRTRGESKAESGVFLTDAGPRHCRWTELRPDRTSACFTVDMGPARFADANLPQSTGPAMLREPLAGALGTAVSMGNPHWVLRQSDHLDPVHFGPLCERDPRFPQRANVSFASVLKPGPALSLRVWERGVGLTRACGTAACASVAACIEAGELPFETWIPVHLPGGILDIWVKSGFESVLMRGSAHHVYSGNLPT